MIQQLLNSFMSQRWEELLLLHWPVDFNKLIDSIPSDIELDLFEGRAWISVVGFKLTQLRISPFRWVPWPAFWEINLRTYVKDRNGKKGVWFYSLDSSDLLAVTGARLLYGLRLFSRRCKMVKILPILHSTSFFWSDIASGHRENYLIIPLQPKLIINPTMRLLPRMHTMRANYLSPKDWKNPKALRSEGTIVKDSMLRHPLRLGHF